MIDFEISRKNLILRLTAAEAETLAWPITTELAMEAAMVLWEAALDPSDVLLTEYRDQNGVVATRHQIMSLAAPLHIFAHLERLHGESGDAFDWEIAPFFLAQCVVWDQHGVQLKPDWQDIARAYNGENHA